MTSIQVTEEHRREDASREKTATDPGYGVNCDTGGMDAILQRQSKLNVLRPARQRFTPAKRQAVGAVKK